MTPKKASLECALNRLLSTTYSFLNRI